MELGKLLNQHLLFDWITKVVINYKKLPKANVNHDITKRRLDTLNAQWEKARILHSNIDYEATEENRKMLPYFVQDHYSEAEAAFESAADFLVTELSKFNKVGTPVHEDDTDSSFCETMKPLLSQLPRIDLPKFSGEFSKWENFRNMFGALVGSNDKITNTLKFHYLKSCVSGDVAKLINNLSMTDDSYPTAWKILMNEYERI